MNTIEIDKEGDVALIQLRRAKANVINHEMVNELSEVFSEFERDDTVRGIILTGQDHFFSAGLDLIELYSYDENEIGHFFRDFGNLYIQMARFPKAFISAITGHSPAGGTVFAICSDYRVMARGEKYVIGLNEVAVNIQISEDIVRGYSFWLGEGPASRLLIEGKLMKVEEAHKVGLVDELCDLSEVLNRAKIQMKKYLAADDSIFRSTKYKCRRAWIDGLSANGEEAFREAFENWWRPEIRQRMAMMIAMLQSKKA